MFGQLQGLLRRAPNSRFVVACRPLSGLASVPWPQARLLPFSNEDIRTLCNGLLGATVGDALCDTLTQSGLLDAFRRPLFARLLALSSPELVARNRFTLGEVFRDVLEVRFLAAWERPLRSRVAADLLREITACVAHTMLENEVYAIDRNAFLETGAILAKQRGVQGDVRYAEELLERMMTHGIIEERNGALQFWHVSFRDYFAALWMERHPSPLGIYWRSWNPHWHETLVIFFGLLQGSRLKARLRELLLGSRVMFTMLSINPYPKLSRRLFLILRCLAQAGNDHRALQRSFVWMSPLEFSHFYFHPLVDRASASNAPLLAHDDQALFCDLVGQFRIPEAFAYLNRIKADVATVAPGLMHDPESDIAERIVAHICHSRADDSEQDKERRGYEARCCADFLVCSSDPRCTRAIRNVLRAGSERVKAALLAELSFSVRFHRREIAPSVRRRLAEELLAPLIEIVLYETGEDLRGTARDLLRSLTDESDGCRLPTVAEEAFLSALNDPSADIRRRALFGLLWSPLISRMDVVWGLLRDTDIGIVFQALRVVELISPKHFPVAVLRVLRHHAKSGSEMRDMIGAVAEHLNSVYPERHWRTHCLAMLICFAAHGKYNGLQSNAVKVLGHLRVPWTAPFLIALFRGEGWVEMRSDALHALVMVLKSKAKPFVLEGLDASEHELRQAAMLECFHDKEDLAFRPLAGPKLYRLLEDPDEFIRRYAALTLEDWGYLTKQWYYRGRIALRPEEPIYLGPVIVESSLE